MDLGTPVSLPRFHPAGPLPPARASYNVGGGCTGGRLYGQFHLVGPDPSASVRESHSANIGYEHGACLMRECVSQPAAGPQMP